MHQWCLIFRHLIKENVCFTEIRQISKCFIKYRLKAILNENVTFFQTPKRFVIIIHFYELQSQYYKRLYDIYW